MECSSLTGKGLYDLGLLLKELKLLTLELQLTNIAKYQIVIVTLDNLNSLFCWRINFIWNHRITEEGKESFSFYLTGISFLPPLCVDLIDLQSSLSILDLMFTISPCQRFGPIEIKNLSNSLKCLEQLQTLHLSFYKLFPITNKGFQALFIALNKLKSLQELKLDISFCNQLHDEGVEHLSLSLKNLRFLCSLDLNFADDRQITDKGVRYLNFALAELNIIVSSQFQLPLLHKGSKLWNIKSIYSFEEAYLLMSPQLEFQWLQQSSRLGHTQFFFSLCKARIIIYSTFAVQMLPWDNQRRVIKFIFSIVTD